jgi:4-carboxymuconolactone decarboxylase
MAVGHSNDGLPAAARAGAAVLAEELTSPQQKTENHMDKATYDRGLEIRKSVLGSEFVDKALASADDFNRPMQDLTTEYCWGYVWGRDGLTRKTRSFLNLAMLCALNRPHELKTHVRGALANGATREEIREVFMQVAIYCGVPAGVDAFRNAKEVFAELDRK